MIELWIILALIAVFMYGTSQSIVKSVLGDISVATMILANFLITMPIYIFFLLSALLTSDVLQFGLSAIVIGIIAGLLGRGGYYTYLEAIESGPVTIVGSITAAYPAIITILAITILGETLSILQAIGVAIVIFGIVAISLLNRDRVGEKVFSKRAIFYCAVTLVLWGVWGLFAKISLDVLPVNLYLGLYTIALPTVLFTYMRGKRINVRREFPKWTLPIIIAIISIEIGQIGLCADTTAVSLGKASIVFPLIAAYPIVTIVEAQTFLKERLSLRQFLLVIAVIAGIVLVSTV